MATLLKYTITRPGRAGINEIDLVSNEEDGPSHGSVVENGIVIEGHLQSREDFTLDTPTSGLCNGIWYVKGQSSFWPLYDGLVVHEIGKGYLQYYSNGILTPMASGVNLMGTLTYDWQVNRHGAGISLIHYSTSPVFYIHSVPSTSAAWTWWPIIGTAGSAHCGTCGFGRNWVADNTKLYWSSLDQLRNFSTGDSGSLDLREVWPTHKADFPVALALGFGKIFIFGLKSILVYDQAAIDPSILQLVDSASELGCIARDSVVSTKKGIFFLSHEGLFFIDRFANVATLMSTSNQSERYNTTLRGVMDSVGRDSQGRIRGAKADYDYKNGNYLLTFPSANITFCVHGGDAEDVHGDPVVTTWTNASAPFAHFASDGSGNLYCAGSGGVYKYGGYTPEDAAHAYSLAYYSNWLSMGDESVLKMYKGATINVETSTGQSGTIYWYKDYDDANADSENFSVDTNLARVTMYGSANTIKVGATFPINGNNVKLKMFHIFLTEGRRKK